jgi:hypothetical protein
MSPQFPQKHVNPQSSKGMSPQFPQKHMNPQLKLTMGRIYVRNASVI